MKAFFKKYLWDFIVLALVGVASLSVVLFMVLKPKTAGVSAGIFRQATLVMNVDLTKEAEERTISVEGTHSPMEITVKKGAIRISHSDCPSHYCVDQGWISNAGERVDCVYNGVYILIYGQGKEDFKI
ncbi:MAG: NusG domain II-containing protein [Bacilli bacterium]|nr:NusG domain II-containing protein [Bacilli bacterium]